MVFHLLLQAELFIFTSAVFHNSLLTRRSSPVINEPTWWRGRAAVWSCPPSPDRLPWRHPPGPTTGRFNLCGAERLPVYPSPASFLPYFLLQLVDMLVALECSALCCHLSFHCMLTFLTWKHRNLKARRSFRCFKLDKLSLSAFMSYFLPNVYGCVIWALNFIVIFCSTAAITIQIMIKI